MNTGLIYLNPKRFWPSKPLRVQVVSPVSSIKMKVKCTPCTCTAGKMPPMCICTYTHGGHFSCSTCTWGAFYLHFYRGNWTYNLDPQRFRWSKSFGVQVYKSSVHDKKERSCFQCTCCVNLICSTSPPGGNQVDGLPPAPVRNHDTLAGTWSSGFRWFFTFFHASRQFSDSESGIFIETIVLHTSKFGFPEYELLKSLN